MNVTKFQNGCRYLLGHPAKGHIQSVCRKGLCSSYSDLANKGYIAQGLPPIQISASPRCVFRHQVIRQRLVEDLYQVSILTGLQYVKVRHRSEGDATEPKKGPSSVILVRCWSPLIAPLVSVLNSRRALWMKWRRYSIWLGKIFHCFQCNVKLSSCRNGGTCLSGSICSSGVCQNTITSCTHRFGDIITRVICHLTFVTRSSPIATSPKSKKHLCKAERPW